MTISAREPAHPVDVLSDALETLDAGGAVFFRGSLGAPWNLTVPTAGEVLEIFGRPGDVDTVLMFHAVLRGALVLELPSSRQPTLLEAGDLVLLRMTEPHVIREGRGGARLSMKGIVGDHDFRKPLVFDAGAGAGGAKLICGGFFLRNTTLHPLLTSLPPVAKVSAGNGFDTVSFLLSRLASESESFRMGSRAVVRRISDLLLVELLRAVIDEHAHGGWLAALRDPVLRRALGVVHADPAADWNVPALARAAGISASGLTQRFRAVLGQSPARYVVTWRMHRATLLMQDPELSLDEVAERVGYGSFPAFSHAFKRSLGRSPGQWRKERGRPPAPG